MYATNVLYPVPPHIKALVNRIVREYEILLHQSHKIALQIFRDNHLYSGIETTEYFLKSVKHFRKLLDTQQEYLVSQTEEDFRKKIYSKICEFYKPLSETAILRITHSSKCQGQVEEAIRAAKRNPNLYHEAKFISWFISNACVQHWCEKDETISHKEFKLIRSQTAFEELVNNQKKYPIFEITQNGKIPFSHCRIALQKFSIEDCYRKQSKLREYRAFWEAQHNIEEFSTDCEIFNMWNNVFETGVYYVYIPKI